MAKSKEEVLDAILQELQETNTQLREMVKQGGATDWKLWIIMNGVCDALLAQGLMDDDPRKTKK
jgi:hypothetical protein